MSEIVPNKVYLFTPKGVLVKTSYRWSIPEQWQVEGIEDEKMDLAKPDELVDPIGRIQELEMAQAASAMRLAATYTTLAELIKATPESNDPAFLAAKEVLDSIRKMAWGKGKVDYVPAEWLTKLETSHAALQALFGRVYGALSDLLDVIRDPESDDPVRIRAREAQAAAEKAMVEGDL